MPSGADLEYARLLSGAGRIGSPAGADGALLEQLNDINFNTTVIANVRFFGAKADGVTNVWQAFNDAAATGLPVIVPAGSYFYSGPGIPNLSNLVFIGAGRSKTTIILDTGSYLFEPGTALLTAHLEGFKTLGGAGALHNTWVGVNVNGHKIVKDCTFHGYTVAAVSSNATDEPYWNFISCQFKGAEDVDNFGVALAGAADSSFFIGCSFLSNRFDVKLRRPSRANFIGCDFLPYDNGDGRSRGAVWTTPVGTTCKGLTFTNCKFSNENITATDFQVIIADDTAPNGDVALSGPDLATDSIGTATGFQFVGCDIQGGSGASPALIYTTTPDLRGFAIGPLVIGGTPPTYVVQFKTPPTASRFNQDSIIGPLIGSDTSGTELPKVLASNAIGWAKLNDPSGFLSTEFHPQTSQAADATSYVKVLPTLVRAFTLSNCTKSDIADATGGADAAEFTFSSVTGQAIAALTTANITPGRPMWIELDIMAGSASSVNTVKLDLQYTGNGATHWKTFKNVPATGVWRRKRYYFNPREATTTIFIGIKASVVGSVKIGRVRVYHADEPIFETLMLPNALTATVAPAAGGGSALPATPSGYVTVSINGSLRQIPYY